MDLSAGVKVSRHKAKFPSSMSLYVGGHLKWCPDLGWIFLVQIIQSSKLGPAIGSGVCRAGFGSGEHVIQALGDAGAALGLSSPGSGLNVFSFERVSVLT